MENIIEIRSSNNHLRLSLEKNYGKAPFNKAVDLCFSLNIKCHEYFVESGTVYLDSRVLSEFARDLEKSQINLNGVAKLYHEYEKNFELEIVFLKLGQVTVQGKYYGNYYNGTELTFNFETDQTFIGNTIRDIKSLVAAVHEE
jgi:hypothetical protein